MDIPSLLVVFVCLWWLMLFTVLPLWIKRAEGSPDEVSPGAPEDPKLKKKFLITTVIAVILTGIVYAGVSMNVIDFKSQAREMAEEDYESR